MRLEQVSKGISMGEGSAVRGHLELAQYEVIQPSELGSHPCSSPCSAEYHDSAGLNGDVSSELTISGM